MIATETAWLRGTVKKIPASFVVAKRVAKSARANFAACSAESNIKTNKPNQTGDTPMSNKEQSKSIAEVIQRNQENQPQRSQYEVVKPVPVRK